MLSSSGHYVLMSFVMQTLMMRVAVAAFEVAHL
jgi:hypothetical protein